MKYYKRLPINQKNPTSDSFVVTPEGVLLTDTHKAIEIPDGDISQRPLVGVEGMLRYNNELNYFEAFTNGQWEQLVAKSTFVIIRDEFDNGDYSDVYFGPLSQNVDVTKPQNVFVYVENVPQIADYNYTLEFSSSTNLITTSTDLTLLAPIGATTLRVSSVADFNNGQRISGSQINPGTTIVTTSATDLTINISSGILASMTSGSVVTTTLGTGTWVRFSNHSLPVPNKPVFVISGFAGN